MLLKWKKGTLLGLVCLLAVLGLNSRAIADEAKEPRVMVGHTGWIIKALGDENNFYGLIGWGEYDELDKNVGYLALERYGSQHELGGGDNADEDNYFKSFRVSILGDAYKAEADTKDTGFTGAKVRLYYADSQLKTEGAEDYRWQGLGLGLGWVITPIRNLHFTVGANFEPKYLNFDWNHESDFQYDWYVDGEFFLNPQFALVWHHVNFNTGTFKESESIQEYSMFGFRYFF